MKKKVMISEIAIILIILCFAWGYYYFHSTEKSTKKLNPNPQLYEACDEDSCIYLLGTIHVGDERLDGLTDRIWKAYQDSEAIAFEVDILASQDLADESLAYLPEGDDLSNYLTKEQLEQLEDFLEKRLISMDFIRKFNLPTVSSLLEQFAYHDLGLLSNLGVDYQLLEKCYEDDKEIIELESAEFQLNLLYTFPNEIYIESIEDILNNYEASKKGTELLYNAYIYGNTLVLSELFGSEDTDDEIHKEYNQKMLIDRNIKMAEKAELYLKENRKIMIAVGDAHIIGEKGLIELLGEKGYKISVVK